MRRWLLWIILSLAAASLSLGLWLLIHHLRGRAAFHQWKAARQAAGDRFGWEAFLPPPVDPELNFAEAPLVRGAILGSGQEDPRFQALSIPKPAQEHLGNWLHGRRDDLEALRQAWGVSDLQTAFEALDPALRELQQASLRPGCRFPIDYEAGQIPAILALRGAVRTLSLRAAWHLRGGRTDQALLDVQAGLRIAEHMKAEPRLINAQHRTILLASSLQVVWEGLEDHAWNEDQLKALQEQLYRVDILASLKLGWQSERQTIIDSLSDLAENRPLPRNVEDLGETRGRSGPLGRGWVYRNLLEYCLFVSGEVDAVEPMAHRVHPERAKDPEAWLRARRFRRDLGLAQIILPLVGGRSAMAARYQALVDEAVIVCALERHRLEKGHYPERLQDLCPGRLPSLPHDLVTGEQLRYARKGDGFVLYQTGWDGEDDQGLTAWSGQGPGRTPDPARGDWAWPHAKP